MSYTRRIAVSGSKWVVVAAAGIGAMKLVSNKTEETHDSCSTTLSKPYDTVAGGLDSLARSFSSQGRSLLDEVDRYKKNVSENISDVSSILNEGLHGIFSLLSTAEQSHSGNHIKKENKTEDIKVNLAAPLLDKTEGLAAPLLDTNQDSEELGPSFGIGPLYTSRTFSTTLPCTGMYLARNSRVNPKVMVQWGQEISEILYQRNFCDCRLLGINRAGKPDRVKGDNKIFMRNIRLLIEEDLYEVAWGEEHQLRVEAYNSYTGNTSFENTIKWYFNDKLVATLIRKMVYVTSQGKPTRLPEDFIRNNPDKNCTIFSLEHATPTEKVISETTINVRPSDIDLYNHIGHPVYVDYLLDAAYHSKFEFLDSDLMSCDIRTIDLEFKYPGFLGKEINIKSWDVDNQANFVMSQFDNPICYGKVSLY